MRMVDFASVLSIVFFQHTKPIQKPTELGFFQHTKPINQSKNQKPTDQNHQVNKPGIIGSKGAMTGVRDHHTTVGGWVFWLVRGPNSGASLQRTPTGTGLSSENSTGKAMVFECFWMFLIILISFNIFNMFQVSLWNFYEFCSQPLWSHCFAGHGFAATFAGRLYDWFSEYRLRAAGREDILEKVGRLGGKDEWLEKTPVGWGLVRHFIGFFWLINKWIQVTSDHWILIHYHIGLYYPKKEIMIATIQWEIRHGQDQKAFPNKNWGHMMNWLDLL